MKVAALGFFLLQPSCLLQSIKCGAEGRPDTLWSLNMKTNNQIGVFDCSGG